MNVIDNKYTDINISSKIYDNNINNKKIIYLNILTNILFILIRMPICLQRFHFGVMMDL